ncbi:protein yellow-like [Physella acuta]|uniref:protein yellow-like n=1 Tax=Physella acuta TaxID=109671 RepID=UPI0027DC1B61|nr:protein yellow-like [Physella acuta]XP_059153948.1 protein yellow-like [Physella acuta]
MRLVIVLMCVLHTRKDIGSAQKVGHQELVHEWTSVTFDWPSEGAEQEARRDGSYVPERNLIAGIEVYKGDIYLSIPRWRWTSGQPATLVKVVNVGGVAKLRPYPDWASQRQGDCRALQFVLGVKVDPSTGLLYVLDTGRVGLAGNVSSRPLNLCQPKIVVFDLNRGTKVKDYLLPQGVADRTSSFLDDLVLDRVDGKVRYAYMSDILLNRIAVFDFQTETGHYIQDPSMEPEVGGADKIRINGKDYSFAMGIDGIAISPDCRFVYYSPLAGFGLYQIPTSTLRSAQKPENTGIRRVGRRITQSGGIAMGSKHLYYTALGLSGVYRWDAQTDMRTQQRGIDTVHMSKQDRVVSSDVTMQWPDGLAIDSDGWLWFVSNRLHLFMTDQMDFSGQDGTNMRVWKVYINDTWGRANAASALATPGPACLVASTYFVLQLSRLINLVAH